MIEINSLTDGMWIEIWKQDEDGMYGNSGEPLYTSVMK